MNTNHHFRHYENNSIVADTASLAEQSMSIKNGELVALLPMAPTRTSQAPANTGI